MRVIGTIERPPRRLASHVACSRYTLLPNGHVDVALGGRGLPQWCGICANDNQEPVLARDVKRTARPTQRPLSLHYFKEWTYSGRGAIPPPMKPRGRLRHMTTVCCAPPLIPFVYNCASVLTCCAWRGSFAVPLQHLDHFLGDMMFVVIAHLLAARLNHYTVTGCAHNDVVMSKHSARTTTSRMHFCLCRRASTSRSQYGVTQRTLPKKLATAFCITFKMKACQ